jgi:hypothetical protein
MRTLFSALFIALTVLFSAPRTQAQNWLDQPFDPAPMSREDIATVQTALAWSGDYYGYADGVWAADAQTALEAWVQREEKAARPLYRHLNRLVMALEDERVKSGWQLFYSETTNTSYLHPFELLKEVENKDAVEFLSDDSGFSVMVRFTDQQGMKDIHDWFMTKAIPGSDPYQFSDSNVAITSVSLDDKMTAYARSDFYNGSWSTISVVVRVFLSSERDGGVDDLGRQPGQSDVDRWRRDRPGDQRRRQCGGPGGRIGWQRAKGSGAPPESRRGRRCTRTDART